jgi:hypothetical protein
MPSSLNVVLQVAAVTAATVMRFAQPGWLVIVVDLTVIGPLAMFSQVVMAMNGWPQRRLPASPAAPFPVRR